MLWDGSIDMSSGISGPAEIADFFAAGLFETDVEEDDDADEDDFDVPEAGAASSEELPKALSTAFSTAFSVFSFTAFLALLSTPLS